MASIQPDGSPSPPTAGRATFSLPHYVLLLCALFVISSALFIVPVFLNDAEKIVNDRFIPPAFPIGIDLRDNVEMSRAWFQEKRTIYRGDPHPPMARVLYYTLTGFPKRIYYGGVVFATLIAFFSVSFILPMLLSKGRATASCLVLTLAGFSSYGLLFELERGQTNVILFSLCAWALYLFHFTPRRFRIVSYLLFTLAIQMKVYPAILVFAFSDGVHAWKKNIIRWTLLGCVAIACLFLPGLDTFRSFMADFRVLMHGTSYWNGNASYSCFSFLLSQTWLKHHATMIANGYLLLYGAAFALMIVMCMRTPGRGCMKYYVMLASIGALILPSESNDYKLPILIMAYSVFSAEYIREHGPDCKSVAEAVIHFVTAGLVCWTLFPGEHKPIDFLLRNNFQPLVAIAVATAVLMLFERRRYGGSFAIFGRRAGP